MRFRGSRRPRDERGAALLMVLVIISVAALAGAATLSFGFASVHTTVALRDQAAAGYAADAAAQAAITQLQRDGYPNDCVTTDGETLDLGSSSAFYQPTAESTTAFNASVVCRPDAVNTTGGDPTAANASPGNAILTLGTSAAEDGIYVSSNGGPVKVRGGIFSNTTINVAAGGLQNTFNNPPYLPYTLARGNCINPDLITPASARTCNYALPDPRGSDPGTLTPHGASYDAPPPAGGLATFSTCEPGNNKYQTVTPGRITSAAMLNDLTGCTTGIVVFTPGIYYLDLDASHVWTVDDIYVIGGTPTPGFSLTTKPKPSEMPNACVKPMDAAATTSSGVEFVLGGASRINLGHQGSPGGQLTLCASKSISGPPIAVYGLKTALGGSFPVSGQSGCVVVVGTAGCPFILSDKSPDTTLTFQGTTYAPLAKVDITLNNNTTQVFRWGLIIRSVKIGATGSPDLASSVIDVPDVAAPVLPVDKLMYLDVRLCAPPGPCGTGGPVALRVKVKLGTGSPPVATVLSWSVQR